LQLSFGVMRLTVGTHHQSGRCVCAPAQHELRDSSRRAYAPGPTDREGLVGRLRRAPAPRPIGSHVPARRRIDVGPLDSVRARVASRVVSCRAPHNETLQLPGADSTEVVVAAALAGTVSWQHLPGQ
jgi:hypothetical protein